MPSPIAISVMPVTVELIVAGTMREMRPQRIGRMRSPIAVDLRHEGSRRRGR